jgi:hypothetical protein
MSQIGSGWRWRTNGGGAADEVVDGGGLLASAPGDSGDEAEGSELEADEDGEQEEGEFFLFFNPF